MMDLKSNLKNQIWEMKIQNNNIIQSIIQRTFLRVWIITFIVFFTWYYVLYLINQWTITSLNYWTIFWISFIVSLLLVIAISWKYSKMNYITLAILAIFFAIAQWAWLSWILNMYELSSVINAFAWAWILFIIMAIWWYTTKKDLTNFWSLLMIWLISIIVLSLINALFIKSWQFDLIISIVWIFIFLWLIAFNLQTLKIMASSWDRRLEIVFWVSLFLDFINLFIRLLIIFWNRN